MPTVRNAECCVLYFDRRLTALLPSDSLQSSERNKHVSATAERTLVTYTATEGVAVIELTNPPANTYSFEMMRQLDEAILQARFDDDVHVILVRGSGEKFFSAGAEISMLNSV